MPELHRIPFRRRARQGLGALMAWPALAGLLLGSCSDGRLAGTSSGVDNPQITLVFRDSLSMATRVTGTLSVYPAAQNPALDASPLATIKVENSSLTNLTGADFERAALKNAGKSTSFVTADSLMAFNVILKTEEGNGSMVLGLVYNATTRTFSRLDRDSLSISRVEIMPRPLVRYEALLDRTNLKIDLGRIYIPGTPYLATLKDSGFVFEDLPQGIFPLRILAPNGNIFAVRESLDTKDPRRFTSTGIPVGKVDSILAGEMFKIDAGGPHQAGYTNRINWLSAKLSETKALPVVPLVEWRQINIRNDSVENRAFIANPKALQTEVKFPMEGIYIFEVHATIRLYTAYDTVTFTVQEIAPDTGGQIFRPKPGERVAAGTTYLVEWKMPKPGPVTISFSPDSTLQWSVLATNYTGRNGAPSFEWKVDPAIASFSQRCLLKVVLDGDSTIAARTAGFFSVIKRGF